MYSLFNVWLLFALGGYGTMEELLEMITWAQLGIHKKPVSVTCANSVVKGPTC